jgi:dihydrofolate reductase
MPGPIVSLIAAVARHGAIGRAGALLWREPQDQRHFRAKTMGAPVIMGRKTWDSLPERFRPLPGRRNIVVTRNPGWAAPDAHAAASLDAALALAADAPRVFVIGGAELYALALPRADELELTEIDAEFDADTFFPAWDRHAFEALAGPLQTSDSGAPFRFVSYRRKTPAAPAAQANWCGGQESNP